MSPRRWRPEHAGSMNDFLIAFGARPVVVDEVGSTLDDDFDYASTAAMTFMEIKWILERRLKAFQPVKEG